MHGVSILPATTTFFCLFFDLKQVFQLFVKGERYLIYKTFGWNLERTIRVVDEANVRRFISEVYSL